MEKTINNTLKTKIINDATNRLMSIKSNSHNSTAHIGCFSRYESLRRQVSNQLQKQGMTIDEIYYENDLVKCIKRVIDISECYDNSLEDMFVQALEQLIDCLNK